MGIALNVHRKEMGSDTLKWVLSWNQYAQGKSQGTKKEREVAESSQYICRCRKMLRRTKLVHRKNIERTIKVTKTSWTELGHTRIPFFPQQ